MATQDNNPQATQAANAAVVASNPNIFGTQPANSATSAPVPAQPVTIQPTQTTPTGQTTPTLANGQPAGGLQMPATPTDQSKPQFDQQGMLVPGTGGLSAAGFNAAKSSGTPPPQDAGTALRQVQGFTPPAPPDTSAIDTQLANDPGYQQLLADQKLYNDTITQQGTLVDQYTKMIDAAGIPALNTQLINAKKIIDGTEDDIRKEVQAAGGFATDSQVMALSAARNKTLIQNYNNLLQTRDNAQNQVNTMIGLAKEDRANALSSITQKLQIDEQINAYRDKMVNAAKEAYNNVIQAVGYSGLLQSLNGDPSSITLAEKSLGLAPGGLAELAGYVKPLTASEQADLAYKQAVTKKTEAETAQLPLDQRLKEAQIAQTKAQTAKIYSDISSASNNGLGVKATSTDIGVAQIIAANPGQWGNAAAAIDKQFGAGTATRYDSWLKQVYQNGTPVTKLVPLGQEGTGNTPQVLAQAQGNVNLISSLAYDQNLPNVVGTNPFARGFFEKLGSGQLLSNPTTAGSKNFVAGVQQLTSQLTLDSLIRAKAQGATFGALSEGELNILAGSATKLNSWAHKDSAGNVQYYDTDEKSFKAELDKINNFAKMDYILKGGNPLDIGVTKEANGTYTTRNSDGTITEL